MSLILLWNPADAERLVENLIGHALAKRRARAPFTVFFACTEPESDLFLSVDNETGEVVLEAPGAKPMRTVAPSLTVFLRGLVPAAPGIASRTADDRADLSCRPCRACEARGASRARATCAPPA